MSDYISADLRRLVAARANLVCEYCRTHESDTFFDCQVDHIISRKHGGRTEPANLAFACAVCNRAKGSDIGSVDPDAGQFVRFFNPRTDHWLDHFALAGETIRPLTPTGRVTAAILGFNELDRVQERKFLMRLGRFPGRQTAGPPA